MPAEAALIISLLSAAISMASAVTAIVAYRLNRYNSQLASKSFSDDHEYRRKVQAVQILMRWDEMTLLARKVIMSRWEKAFDENQTIPWSEIDEYRASQIQKEKKAGRLDSKPRLITDQMAIVMNYFELLATAICFKAANEELLRRNFENTFKRWYTILSDYRRHIKQTRHGDPWGGTLDWLFHQWSESDLVPLPETGKPP